MLFRSKIFTPILTYFRQCFSIPYYRWVVTGMVLGFFCSTPVNIFSIFYAKSLEVDMKLYGIFITVTYAVSLAISYFLGILADRFHPLRTGIVSLAVYLATMIAGWVFVDGARSFGVILILHGIVSGCFFTLAASLGQRLFPKKLFAQFNSAFAMLLAIVSVTCGPFFGWLLDRLNHNYRFVFLIGGLFTLLAILALWKVHRYYLEYGGDAAYTPPDPESSARVE